LLLSQDFVEIASGITVYFDLGKDREIDVIFRLCEFQYLSIGTRFLRTELVTGETQNGKITVTEGFLKGTQTCVLWCQTSLTG